MSASVIKGQIEKAVNTVLTEEVLDRGMEAAGKAAIEVIRERSRAGFDNRGRKVSKYSKQYARRKQAYVSGRMKGKSRKSFVRRFGVSPNATPLKAREVYGYFTLTGSLLSDMYVRSVSVTPASSRAKFHRGEITIDFRTRRKSDQLVDVLAKQGRDIRGLAPPSTSWGRRERTAMISALKTVTKLPANRQVSFAGAKQ